MTKACPSSPERGGEGIAQDDLLLKGMRGQTEGLTHLSEKKPIFLAPSRRGWEKEAFII